ncbi:MAG: hypothetical protein IKO65_08075 [Victivallales bacterium]|nr:hypothetical protein [Victivallales bacterium]
MKHYTKEELELYRHGQMSVLGRINCATHLEACEECRNLLEELKSDDDFMKELRSSLMLYESVAKESERHPQKLPNHHTTVR